MSSYTSRATAQLPRAKTKNVGPVSQGDYFQAMSILDVFCTWALPGTPWLDELFEVALEQLLILASRDPVNYAWARRDFMSMVRSLDRDPEPVELPEMYRDADVDPAAIMRVAVDFEPDSEPEPKPEPRRTRAHRIGRNEKCRCGSGRKYKRCCWRGDVREDVEGCRVLH